MNIVYVSHYPGQGGANKELVLLIEQMLQYGHNIYVVMPSKGWLYDELSKKCSCVVYPYHRWVEDEKTTQMHIRRLFKAAVNWKAAYHLKSYFIDKRIDVVHTNDSITVVGAYLARLLKCKHIWHMREIYDTQFGLKHTYSEEYCMKWIQRAETVIAISKAVENRYTSYNPKNLVMIYDGCIVPEHKYTKQNSERLEMLFCGGTSVHKGFDDVVAVAKLLQCEGMSFRIIVAASSNVDEKLKIELEHNNIYDNFEFVGFVNNLEEYRQKCDILLMCSKDEAFGLVTIEGMLSKVVVIGRNAGATSELIEDGRTGCLYNTVDELFEKIKLVIAGEAKSIIENAYDYAVNNFSIATTAEKIENLYER